MACIPAYKEKNYIGDVVSQALKFVDKVIVCDDGSGDDTGLVAQKLGAHIVVHEINRGYGATIQSLIKEAKNSDADFMVTLDGDGQHDPKEIPLLIDRLLTGDCDIVIGSRFLERGSSEAPKWREFGIKIITSLVKNNGTILTDGQSGFRAYNRHALESLNLIENGMGISTEILIKAERKGLVISEVPVNISYHENSSTENPVLHGISVLIITIKHILGSLFS